MSSPHEGGRHTYTKQGSSPAALKLEILALDTLDEVIADLEGFTQGHLNSTLFMEANGWRLINRARELRQARRAA